MSTIKPP